MHYRSPIPLTSVFLLASSAPNRNYRLVQHTDKTRRLRSFACVCGCVAKSLALMKSTGYALCTFRVHLEGFQQSAEVLISCKIGVMFTA